MQNVKADLEGPASENPRILFSVDREFNSQIRFAELKLKRFFLHTHMQIAPRDTVINPELQERKNQPECIG